MELGDLWGRPSLLLWLFPGILLIFRRNSHPGKQQRFGVLIFQDFTLFQ